MTEQDYKRASEIMAEIEVLRKQIEALPRIIVSPTEYKWTNHKYGYVRRTLCKIKNKFAACGPDLNYGQHYGEMQVICELSEDDLLALIDIRKNKVAALKEELQRLGNDKE